MVEARDGSLLSTRKIPRAQRLIFALDVPERDEALRLVRGLGDAVDFYKVGLELFVRPGCFELVDELFGMGKRVFADLKLLDVAETVGRAVRNLRGREGLFVTVHACDPALAAAVREKGGTRVIAVTVLTNLDKRDLVAEGYPETVEVEELVLARARRAQELGCDGVVASGREARRIRRELGGELLIVTPGIRPSEDRRVPGDDQKRVMTPREAFLSGADYIVVGRPIRDAAEGPRAAALRIQAEIADLFPA
jgi:orotidine-5'-phosphate decarboxylase